jgi:hypothetical protein
VHHNSLELILVVVLRSGRVLLLVAGYVTFVLTYVKPLACVRFQVEQGRELKPVAHLLVLQRVQVEHDPLEVDDEHVRQLRETLPPHDIVLLLACLTVEIADRFATDVRLQRFVDVLHALNLDR